MLGILRRAFSFSDWTRHHPTEPVPGDMLDASFDAQNQRISELEALIRQVLRSDGRLQNETVSFDSMEPAFLRFFRAELDKSIEKLRFELSEHAISAVKAEKQAIEAQEAAEMAAARVEILKNTLDPLENTAIGTFSRIEEQAAVLTAALQAEIDARAVVEPYAGDAEAWADTSRAWAEHMPDTIPGNSLAETDVTGDHWSSRWWANYASQIVSDGLGTPGPQGPQGPTGPTGPAGPEGPPGADAAGLTDGDKGDIVVSGSGTSFMLDPDRVKGVVRLTVSATAPAAPAANDVWIDIS